MLDSTYTRAVLPTNNPELLIENYLIVASSALLWYDFTLTFTTEYCRIWQREFSGATIVYFSMRYIAVVERVFLVFKALMRHSSQKMCRGIAHADDALVFANYLAFAAFICLRVYGVCSSNWKPLLVVLPLTLIGPILSLYEGVHYFSSQPGPSSSGCVYFYDISSSVTSNVYIISRATTITAGVILVVLTWIKAGGIKKESLHTRMHTPLADLLLRDGTAYFIILVAMQIMSLTSKLVGRELAIWLACPYFSQTLTAICLSRFMLDLRGLYSADLVEHEVEAPHWSDVYNHTGSGSPAGTDIRDLSQTLSTETFALPTRYHVRGNSKA